MRTKHFASVIVLSSFATLLAACGTGPAPSHNASGSHAKAHGSTKGQKAGKQAGTKAGANKPAKSSGSSTNAKPISLTTLPMVTAVAPFNPHLKDYHEVSAFINEMGYHWATQVPGMVYMTNQHNQITAVETTFPQNLGTFSWYDPPTPPTVLNASLAFYSEHLYFVPPTSITPSMSASEPTDLSSWTSFVTGNPRLKVYVKEPTTYHGYDVYGPPNGPGIKVLVNPSSGLVSGFLVAEPASWGWNPVYKKDHGKPFTSKVFSKAYYSVFMLEPPHATSSKTTS